MNKLKNDIKDKSFKIALVDNIVTSRGMNTRTALELLPPIKSIDNDIQVIIFADSENIELKATSSKLKPAAFIKKDSQYFVRLYPLISRLISEYELKRKMNASRKSTFYVLAIFVIAAILFGVGYFVY
jgi:DNA-binding NtrC family response regulator